MRWLSKITAELKIGEIMDLLRPISRDPQIAFIKEITINGPTLISIDDIEKSYYLEDFREREFYIWNRIINIPICWELFLLNYSAKLEPSKKPIINKKETREEYQRSTIDKIQAFRKRKIDELFFYSGHLSSSLSPIIELELPFENKQGIFSLSAEWEIDGPGFWICWDELNNCWKHEDRKELERVLVSKDKYSLPAAYIEWQDEVIGMVKQKYKKYIVDRYTYELGEESEKESIDRLIQTLADAVGKEVAGINPRPPVPSKRK
jgi:hypothetical protein